MGVAKISRDSEAVRAGLLRWVTANSHGSEIGPLTRPNDGLSSETYLFDVDSHSLVARLPPAGAGLFPTYALAAQGRLQNTLAALGIPTAAPVTIEDDESWVGAPFVLMPKVEGRLLTDNPPYARKGWLKDAGAQMQRTVFVGFLDALAAIHALDWETAGLEWVARPQGTTLAAEVDWWADYLPWATGGQPEPHLDKALAWCRESIPDAQPPPSLLWGDVRLGNVIYDEAGAPAAILDWEMASIGPAEVDLGWFFALREMLTGPDGTELPGFLPKSEALAHYATKLGRPVDDLEWYEVFALLRSTAILVRMQRLLVEQGQTDHWLVGFDPVPARLTQL